MKTSEILSRQVWFAFTHDGKPARNQITIPAECAASDSEAIAQAREYMTEEESATAREIRVIPVSAFSLANPLTANQWQDVFSLIGKSETALSTSERSRVAFYRDAYGI